MADIVTPSAFSPQPKAAAPAAPVVKPTTPAAPVAPAAPSETELATLRAAAANAKRSAEVRVLQAQKAAAEKEKGFGAKLTRLAELEKLEGRAKLDPGGYLEAKLGPNWYDIVLEAKVSGGAPTHGAVKSELDKLREEFEAKLAARDEESKKQSEASKAQALTESRRQVVSEAGRFWSAKAAEYPLIESRGTAEQIAGEMARRIEGAYLSSIQRDESGHIVVDGVVPNVQTIAEAWEGELVKLAEVAAGHAKYAERFKPKPSNAVQPQSRTLSNDLTGTTPSQRPPPANNEEKRARAEAAYLAARKPAT